MKYLLAILTAMFLVACGETSTTEPMVEEEEVTTLCHIEVGSGYTKTDENGDVIMDSTSIFVEPQMFYDTVSISPCVSAYYNGVKGWFDMDCKFHAFTDSVSFVCGMDGLPSSSSKGPPADLLNADTTTNN